MKKLLLPKGWPMPSGFSQGIAVRGTQIFVAGQIGWTSEGFFESDEFWQQTRQALKNTVSILSEAGAKPEHIVRMTWYITDCQEYLSQLKQVGEVYREIIGVHFPVMTIVEISKLLEKRAKLEIETTAVIPEGNHS